MDYLRALVLFLLLFTGVGCARMQGEKRSLPESPRPLSALGFLWEKAEQGDAASQLKLGQAFDQGEGVPLDHAMAEVWYERAALNGNEEAKGLLGNAPILKCSDGQRFIVSFDNGGETGQLLIDGHNNPQILKNNKIASGIELQSDNGDYVFIEHLGRVVLSSLGKSAKCREVEK